MHFRILSRYSTNKQIFKDNLMNKIMNKIESLGKKSALNHKICDLIISLL